MKNPPPYKVERKGTDFGKSMVEIQTQNDVPIAIVTYNGDGEEGDDRMERAAFICLACNTHATLVDRLTKGARLLELLIEEHKELTAACRAALERLTDPYLGEDEGQRQALEIEQLRAVLAKVEGMNHA